MVRYRGLQYMMIQRLKRIIGKNIIYFQTRKRSGISTSDTETLSFKLIIESIAKLLISIGERSIVKITSKDNGLFYLRSYLLRIACTCSFRDHAISPVI